MAMSANLTFSLYCGDASLSRLLKSVPHRARCFIAHAYFEARSSARKGWWTQLAPASQEEHAMVEL
eukprot:363632-Chlamydomonas_euryale.AAC.3